MKKLLFCIILFTFHTLHAQNVTGYWYGQANVEMAGLHNNYLTELIIAQKGTRIKGFFGYYFKDTYQSFLVKGTYDPATRRVIITDIPIIYFNTNSTINSVDCIASFYGTLLVSKVKTSLSGYLYRDKKYTYTCPDLRVNYTLYTEERLKDSSLQEMVAIKRTWKSQANNYVADDIKGTNEEAEAEATVAATQKAKTPEIINKTKRDTANAQTAVAGPAIISSAVADLPVIKPVVREDISKIKEQFKKRRQVFGNILEIASDSVRLSFYDNAEIDGDSISVFVNKQLVLAHQELTERAFNVYVKLDSLKEINEVSMFAENLGKYPPNTALMVVNDGDKRYEVFLSSDFKGNATVQFRRKKTL
jgi:hypothetical protein